MSSEESQSLTGYIEGDYLHLNYGDYQGSLDISEDVKYCAENYETMISWYNDTWSCAKVTDGKIVLKFEVGGVLKDIILRKSLDLQQIQLEQQNEMSKMQKKIAELETRVNELSKPVEGKVKTFKIRIEDRSSANPIVNGFLKDRQLLVKSYEVIRARLEIVVYSLNNNKYHKLSMGFSGNKQVVKSCDNITIDYQYPYFRSDGIGASVYYVEFTEHYIKGDNWHIVE